MTQYRYKFCDATLDRAAVIDLFIAVKDELHLPDRSAVEQMVDLIFTRGGIIAAYHRDQMVGAGGYFFGDPTDDFADKSLLFIYVAAILPDFRGTRLFHGCLVHLLSQMQKEGMTAIRMQAETTNPFTNKLYGRFARKLGPGKSLRGIDVNVYGAPITEALAALSGRKRPSAAAYAPTPHHAPRVTCSRAK